MSRLARAPSGLPRASQLAEPLTRGSETPRTQKYAPPTCRRPTKNEKKLGNEFIRVQTSRSRWIRRVKKMFLSAPYHGKSWEVMGNHGRSWEVMGGHGKSWEVMGGHGRSWEVMVIVSVVAIVIVIVIAIIVIIVIPGSLGAPAFSICHAFAGPLGQG